MEGASRDLPVHDALPVLHDALPVLHDALPVLDALRVHHFAKSFFAQSFFAKSFLYIYKNQN